MFNFILVCGRYAKCQKQPKFNFLSEMYSSFWEILLKICGPVNPHNSGMHINFRPNWSMASTCFGHLIIETIVGRNKPIFCRKWTIFFAHKGHSCLPAPIQFSSKNSNQRPIHSWFSSLSVPPLPLTSEKTDSSIFSKNGSNIIKLSILDSFEVKSMGTNL